MEALSNAFVENLEAKSEKIRKCRLVGKSYLLHTYYSGELEIPY